MSAPFPGRLIGLRVGGIRSGRLHPPASPPPASLFQPVRLALPPGVGRRDLAAIWRATWVMFAVDDSGSMYGQHADDQGVRYAAARSIVDFMVRAGGGHAGVVHWGSNAPADLTLAPVNVRWRRRALETALRIPRNLGGTNMVAGFQRAKQLLPAPQRGQHQAVLVLTDGVEQTGTGPELVAAINQLPAASVHLLLIDHWHSCTPELEDAWRALPLGSFTRLPLDDPAQLSWQVADVLVRSRGLSLPPLSVPGKWRFSR